MVSGVHFPIAYMREDYAQCVEDNMHHVPACGPHMLVAPHALLPVPLAIHKENMIARDSVQVLEFSKHILEDLSNYDINSAWPTLIDEFVSHVRCKHCPLKDSTSMSPSALAHAGLLPDRVSPKAGSKRKLADSDAEDLSKRFASMYREGSVGSLPRYGTQGCVDMDVQILR